MKYRYRMTTCWKQQDLKVNYLTYLDLQIYVGGTVIGVLTYETYRTKQ